MEQCSLTDTWTLEVNRTDMICEHRVWQRHSVSCLLAPLDQGAEHLRSHFPPSLKFQHSEQ